MSNDADNEIIAVKNSQNPVASDVNASQSLATEKLRDASRRHSREDLKEEFKEELKKDQAALKTASQADVTKAKAGLNSQPAALEGNFTIEVPAVTASPNKSHSDRQQNGFQQNESENGTGLRVSVQAISSSSDQHLLDQFAPRDNRDTDSHKHLNNLAQSDSENQFEHHHLNKDLSRDLSSGLSKDLGRDLIRNRQQAVIENGSETALSRHESNQKESNQKESNQKKLSEKNYLISPPKAISSENDQSPAAHSKSDSGRNDNSEKITTNEPNHKQTAIEKELLLRQQINITSTSVKIDDIAYGAPKNDTEHIAKDDFAKTSKYQSNSGSGEGPPANQWLRVDILQGRIELLTIPQRPAVDDPPRGDIKVITSQSNIVLKIPLDSAHILILPVSAQLEDKRPGTEAARESRLPQAQVHEQVVQATEKLNSEKPILSNVFKREALTETASITASEKSRSSSWQIANRTSNSGSDNGKLNNSEKVGSASHSIDNPTKHLISDKQTVKSLSLQPSGAFSENAIGMVSSKYVLVNSRLPDKRYIFGTEFAIAAVIASAGISRVRNSEQIEEGVLSNLEPMQNPKQPSVRDVAERVTSENVNVFATEYSSITSPITSSITSLITRDVGGDIQSFAIDKAMMERVRNLENRYLFANHRELANFIAKIKETIVVPQPIHSADANVVEELRPIGGFTSWQKRWQKLVGSLAAAQPSYYPSNIAHHVDENWLIIDGCSNVIAGRPEENQKRTQDEIPISHYLSRPQILVSSEDTLVSVAEEYFHDANIGWLIADLNRLNVKESIVDGKRIIELQTRQTIILPVWSDIVSFYKHHPDGVDVDNLITIVETSNIDRELATQIFAPVLKTNRHEIQ